MIASSDQCILAYIWTAVMASRTTPVPLISLVFFEKQWFGKIKSCSVVAEGEKFLYTGKSGKKINTRNPEFTDSFSPLSPLSPLQLSLLDKSITLSYGNVFFSVKKKAMKSKQGKSTCPAA